MSRLLVVTYHLPPDPAVGGQRWAGLSKYLAKQGWDVHIVTAAAPKDYRDAPGVHRHVVPRRRTLNDRYRDFAARRRPAGASGASGAKVPPAPAPATEPASERTLWSAIAWSVRRLIGVSLIFPDHSRGWVMAAARTARALLESQPFDLVVSSGPPHLGHYAAMLANAGRSLPHVIDMRDPWASAHERHGPHEDYFITRMERVALSGFERVMFARAAKIIVNTQAYAAVLTRERPDLDVIWFPNGIDVSAMPPRDPAGVIRGSMAHVGALYAGRNLSSVLAAMASLLAERPDADRLSLHLAGPMEPAHREMMNARLADPKLAALVHDHGVLPRAEALALLNRAHLALCLAQNQGMAVPAKLYESVGLGVPTLVIAEAGSAAARESRRIGALNVDGEDVAGTRAVLADMLDGRIPDRMDAITPITYDALAVEMDKLLRSVMAR